jgi:hypothetical protein
MMRINTWSEISLHQPNFKCPICREPFIKVEPKYQVLNEIAEILDEKDSGECCYCGLEMPRLQLAEHMKTCPDLKKQIENVEAYSQEDSFDADDWDESDEYSSEEEYDTHQIYIEQNYMGGYVVTRPDDAIFFDVPQHALLDILIIKPESSEGQDFQITLAELQNPELPPMEYHARILCDNDHEHSGAQTAEYVRNALLENAEPAEPAEPAESNEMWLPLSFWFNHSTDEINLTPISLANSYVLGQRMISSLQSVDSPEMPRLEVPELRVGIPELRHLQSPRTSPFITALENPRFREWVLEQLKQYQDSQNLQMIEDS